MVEIRGDKKVLVTPVSAEDLRILRLVTLYGLTEI